MRTSPLIAVVVVAAIVVAGGCHLSEPQRAGNPLAPALAATAALPDSHPAPPPPSPKPSFGVQFDGSDSVAAGRTSNTLWRFGNTGHSTVTATWTLTGDPGWPGLPEQGIVTVPPLGSQLLSVPVAVPDSATPGFHALHMAATTTQKRTAGADGAILVTGGTDSTAAR